MIFSLSAGIFKMLSWNLSCFFLRREKSLLGPFCSLSSCFNLCINSFCFSSSLKMEWLSFMSMPILFFCMPAPRSFPAAPAWADFCCFCCLAAALSSFLDLAEFRPSTELSAFRLESKFDDFFLSSYFLPTWGVPWRSCWSGWRSWS